MPSINDSDIKELEALADSSTFPLITPEHKAMFARLALQLKTDPPLSSVGKAVERFRETGDTGWHPDFKCSCGFEAASLAATDYKYCPYCGKRKDGEPIFTVLGRDQLAQAVVLYWIDRARAAGVPEEKIARAEQRYREIINFQSDNPDRVKQPD